MSDQSPIQGVAIVGVAGRFPGAKTAREFWTNIKAGVESISFFDDAQLASAGHNVADLRADPDFVAARGIIHQPEWFDAQFFGMTPIEAEVTDPQQRVLLEVAWEALEEAGYDVSRYRGAVGVYAGVGTNAYYLNCLLARPDVLKAVGPMQAMIGREKDFVATRVAYKLDLTGPAINVNSACSTSLVAVCQAVQALLTYQCDMALAGGAMVMYPQETGYVTEDEGIYSPDGHTRAFDADARGTAFSNGVGLVVLKRVEDAIADGDHIYAVVRGAALNNDGAGKASFMAPSSKGHAEVIAMAHALAGVEPRTIGYVEAHGTATPIGDPIEVEGLTEAFRSGTGDTRFCALGSVKTNVGHLDVAAGVTGLIKAAFALHEGVLPPSLHYRKPNPRIDFDQSPFYVNTSLTPWVAEGPRRAGVSSFGVGGTNAHVVLEEAPAQTPSRVSSDPQLLVLSARTPTALAEARTALADHLSGAGDLNLADVAHTLQTGRRAFPHRFATVAGTVGEAVTRLREGAATGQVGEVTETRRGTFAFADLATADQLDFSLGHTEPAFREAVHAALAAAPPAIAGTLRSAIESSAITHHRPDAAMQLVWQYAVGRLLESWGLAPAGGSAEGVAALAAACASGTMTLDAALDLATQFPAGDSGTWRAAVHTATSDVATTTPHDSRPADLVITGRMGSRGALLRAVSALWVTGSDVNWTSVTGADRRRVSLPTYRFERKRFSADPRPATRPTPPASTQPAATATLPASTPGSWQVLPISATSADALATTTATIAARLESGHEPLELIARELQQRRPADRARRAVVSRSTEDAARRLLREPAAERVQSPSGAGSPSVIFMFAGGGAQYAGAAHGLYASSPIFRRAVDDCCELVDPTVAGGIRRLIGTRAAEVSSADRAMAERPSVGLPLLFAVEYGLVELWRSFGVSPVALIGHSLGEYTAACVSGVLSLEDAVGLVAVRGQLFEHLKRGSMMAVPAAPSALARYLSKGLDIAAVNGPTSCVISGPVDDIERTAAALQADDIDAVPLHINVAAHSSMVEPIMAAFGDRVRKARLSSPSVPFVSNVTGDWISETEATNPDYWVRHLRQTVRFSDGVATLCQLTQPLFLEVGPGRVLSSLVKGHPALPSDATIVQSVRHPNDERDDCEVLLSASGRLWAHGVDVQWTAARDIESGCSASAAEPRPSASVPAVETPAPVAIAVAAPAPIAREPRKDRISAKLRGIIQELGGIDAATLPDATSFVELGFDSLSLTQVAQGVRKAFGVRIRFRQLLEAIPTIDALAGHIDREMPAETTPPAAAAAATTSAPMAAAGPSAAVVPGSDPVQAQLAMMAEQIEALRRAVQGGTAAPASTPLAPTDGAAQAVSGAGSAKRFGPYVPPDTKRRLLSETQERALQALIARYASRTRGSKALTDRQRPTLADARAITGFKAQWKEIVYQIAMTRSSGSRMVDVDGNEYVDFTMNFGASLFGHSPAFLTEAVERQLHAGLELGVLSPLAAPVAEMLARMTGMDRVAFANTGTDAIMGALRAARTVTGRDQVITFRGGYHGMNDEMLAQAQGTGASTVVQPAVPGVPPHAVAGTIVLDYEDPHVLDELKRHLPNAAAVLIEPIQSRRPAFDARQLFGPIRELTREAGAALIFDELITGFRLHPRGAQGWFGIDVDIATYGKILGNGMPVAAIAGRSEFMEAFDGGVWQFGDDSQPEGNVTFYGGTHTRHPLGLAAAQAVLSRLEVEGPALQEGLARTTSALCARINDLFERKRVSIRVDCAASMFLFRFPSEGAGRATLESSAGTLERLIFYYLREKGVHIWDRPAFLSTAHSPADLDTLVGAIESSVDEMLAAGFLETVDGPVPMPITQIAAPAFVALPPGSAPLSAGQKEIWLASHVADGGSLSFNQSVTLTFDGALDTDALQQALDQFVARHEALRITFDPSGESQRVHAADARPLTLIDYSSLDDAAFRAALEALIETDSTTPFDLTRGPLCRYSLIRRSPSQHVLLFDAHHIICDGWSVTTLAEELGPLYRAAVARQSPDLPPAAKFTDWVRDHNSLDTREDEAYWLGQFTAPVPALELPLDRPRPAAKTYPAGTSIKRAAGAAFESLKRASAEAGTTTFVGVLSAYALLLQALSGQRDIVIGCAAAGQNGEDESALVGHCVSLLPVRLQITPELPVADLLAHARRQVLDAFDHQSYTYGQLIEKLRIRREASRQPLLSTLITYEVDSDLIDYTPLSVQIEAHPRRFCNFEIELHVRASKSDLLIWLYFNSDLFDQATVDRWTTYLVRIVGELGRDPHRPLGLVPVLPEDERERLLHAWNATAVPEGPLTVEQIDARVAEQPTAIAVADHTGATLTRQDLLDRSVRIARALRAAGLDGSPVGLCVDRSVQMVAALIGIFRAGAAYLPLDPDLPAARLAAMLEDSRASVVITRRHLTGSLPQDGRRYLVLDDLTDAPPAETTPLPPIAPDSPAYVIYTSGSTGRPKGVEVTHRNLANFLASMQQAPGLSATDRLLAITTTSFDIAGLELYLPLITGATVFVASREQASDPARLAERIERDQINVLQGTPATWRMLLDSGWTPSRPMRMLCGGEAMSRDLANRLTTISSDVWNLYGPTETTIWSTIYRVSAGSGPVPIGRPIANTQTYVLDAMKQPAPTGVRGELYIGGTGVARGYLNRPDLTADRFVADPFAGTGTARMYRTGDAARWRADGTLECLERLDHQVKLRGFRIELGEIESALMQPGVTAAVVVLREDTPGDARLVAYVTPVQVDAAALRASVREKLPEYMVPAAIVPMAAFPQTASGKVDRKRLPPPAGVETAVVGPSRGPSTVTEAVLVELWRDVLRLSSVGVDDNFFDVGGHSLLAVRLATKMTERLGRNVPFGVLLSYPTIRELAAHLAPDETRPAPAAHGEPATVITFQSQGSKAPLFFVHGIEGDVWTFVELAKRFGSERPIYGLQASENPAEGTTVAQMAERYLREIRRIVPSGPYLLGGFCSGAAIAYEMAQQLRASGDRVGLLAAIDYGFFETVRRRFPGGGVVDFAGNVARWVREDAMSAGPKAILGRIFSKGRLLLARLKHPIARTSSADVRDKLGLWRYQDHQVRMLEIYAKAFDQYQPRPYAGHVTVVRARTLPLFGREPEHDLGWGRLAGSLDVHVLPGSHDTILKPPYVAAVAAALQAAIAAGGGPVTSGSGSPVPVRSGPRPS